MLADGGDACELSGSRQRTMHQLHTLGAGRHPQRRNAVEQPRRARLDATVGGFAPQGNVKYRFWYLTFHSTSSRRAPPPPPPPAPSPPAPLPPPGPPPATPTPSLGSARPHALTSLPTPHGL